MASEHAEWRQKILGALRELKADYRREEQTANGGRGTNGTMPANETGTREPATAA